MFAGGEKKESDFLHSIILQIWKGGKPKVHPFTFGCNGQQVSS